MSAATATETIELTEINLILNNDETNTVFNRTAVPGGEYVNYDMNNVPGNLVAVEIYDDPFEMPAQVSSEMFEAARFTAVYTAADGATYTAAVAELEPLSGLKRVGDTTYQLTGFTIAVDQTDADDTDAEEN